MVWWGMVWWGWFGVVLALTSAWSLWGTVRANRRRRDRVEWPTTTGRITETKVDRIADDGGGRQVHVYVEYQNDDGVTIGFWNPWTVSDRTPFGGKVDIKVNPDNRYQGEITSTPFAVDSSVKGTWWGSAVLIVAGVALVVLALLP